VKYAVLYGENRYEMLKSAREYGVSISLCEDMELAVKIAIFQAKSGQAVLLSPASASFDQFADYEERGDKFVEIVYRYKRERNKEGEEVTFIQEEQE
jgi:UDP-N-acetylmuramoylalanine--D-glutamate ligase